MNIKLLLDENLSPWAAVRLRDEFRLDVVHVRDRGLLGASDEQVFVVAYAEDRVVVTSNGADFVKLARGSEVHAGLVLFEDSGLLRDEQLEVTRAAVALLLPERDLVNRLLRIWRDGRHAFETIPPA